MSTVTANAPPNLRPTSQAKRRQAAGRGPLLKANFRVATKALMVNSTRSILTMLGVIIGVAAVITATTQAEGAATKINQNFSSLGARVLTIMSGSPPSGGAKGGFTVQIGGGSDHNTLSLSDAAALSRLDHIVQISPMLSDMRHVTYRDQSTQFVVYGVAESYAEMHSLQLTEGDWFSNQNGSSAVPDAVLGSDVATSLFGTSKVDPIGQMIRIAGVQFHVVGVLASASFAFDENIYAPLAAVQLRLTNTTKVPEIEVQVDDTSNIDAVETEITSLLEQRHRVSGTKDDFWIQSPAALIQNEQASSSSLAALLIGIAAISLTVGGIGIMNIMLVSVTERTREIGIRLAVGANRNDIRNQFLIEAVLLSATGGIIGVFFGVFIGYEIVNGTQLPFILDPTAILIAVGVSGLIGMVFGLFPAIRAAQLDPIVALQTT